MLSWRYVLKIGLCLILTRGGIATGGTLFPFSFVKNQASLTYASLGAYTLAGTGWATGKTYRLGTGDAMLSGSRGIAIDSARGILYVADTTNNRIVKYDATTGAFVGAIGKVSSTSGTCLTGSNNAWCTGGVFIAGTGDGGYSQPIGLALDAAGTYLYVVDSSNSRIVKITAATGAVVGAIGKVTSITGGSCVVGIASSWCTGGVFSSASVDGSYKSPSYVALDETNDFLYVSDTTNYRIVQAKLSTGLFVGAVGKVTAVTTGSCVVGVASTWCTGGTFGQGCTDGMFYGPVGIGVDPTSDVLIVAERTRLIKMTASSGTFVGAVGKVSATSTGSCVASSLATTWCTGGTFAGSSVDGGYSIGSYTGLTLNGTSGFIYVSDQGNGKISKVSLGTGTFVGAVSYFTTTSGTCNTNAPASGWCTGGSGTTFGSDDGMFNGIYATAIDPTNNRLYACDGDSAKIAQYNLSSGAFLQSLGLALNSTPGWSTGLASYVSASTVGGFYNASAIAIDKLNGYLLVSQNYSRRIDRIDLATGAYAGSIGYVTASTGTCVAGAAATGWCLGGTFTGSSGDGSFSNNNGLVVDTAGNLLYVADGPRISKFNLTTGAFIGSVGKVTASSGSCVAGTTNSWCTKGTFASGAGDGTFSSPTNLAIDIPHGYLYVADTANARIVRLNLSTGTFAGAIGKVTSVATGSCVVGPAPAWCTGGTFGTAATDGAFTSPTGLAVDSAGNLYVGDRYNNRVSKFLMTGALVGSIGRTTSSTGSCPNGGYSNGWCTGGTFFSSPSAGAYSQPLSLYVHEITGLLYVANYGLNRIDKLNLAQGIYLGSIGRDACGSGPAPGWCTGGNGQSGTVDGNFNTPYSVAVDPVTTMVYVSDYANFRLQRVKLP